MVRPALDLDQLTVTERLALIQAVWDSLRAHPETLPLSAEERALIAARREEHRRDPGGAVPWDQVRAELWADQVHDESVREGGGAGGRGG
jgi:putative addiction module component (TIGR02574 family)